MLMRTTIHLVSARDCLEIRPIIQPVVERQWRYSPFAKALAGLDIDEVLDAGLALLAERPQTAGAIGKRLAERWPDRDPSSLGHAVRWLVPMVQIPPRGLWGRGGQPVLETVERWLGAPLSKKPSLDDLVLRYLAAFGPATAKDFGVWSWLTGIGEVVERLRPRLVTYRDEAGRELFDVPDMALPDPKRPLRCGCSPSSTTSCCRTTTAAAWAISTSAAGPGGTARCSWTGSSPAPGVPSADLEE